MNTTTRQTSEIIQDCGERGITVSGSKSVRSFRSRLRASVGFGGVA